MSGAICPVCGYALDFLPWKGESPSDEICPSCGIQFGYDDFVSRDPADRIAVYKEWRERWIEAGMPWFSHGRHPPENWDPEAQLSRVR